MIADALTELVSAQHNRPLSLTVAVLALFVPSSLVIFLARPQLYEQLGLNGIILLSIAVSFPVVLLCFALWYTVMLVLLRADRMIKGQPLQQDLETALKADDPLEWPCILMGGWSANLILFLLAAIAYAKQISLGRSYLLIAAILLSVWIVGTTASIWLLVTLERRLKAMRSTGPASS